MSRLFLQKGDRYKLAESSALVTVEKETELTPPEGYRYRENVRLLQDLASYGSLYYQGNSDHTKSLLFVYNYCIAPNCKPLGELQFPVFERTGSKQ